MAKPAQATVHIDNDRVIVTEYRFEPDASTGWHRHEHDYVIVPLLDGKLKVITADGETMAPMTGGGALFPQGWGRARHRQCQRWRLCLHRDRAEIGRHLFRPPMEKVRGQPHRRNVSRLHS